MKIVKSALALSMISIIFTACSNTNSAVNTSSELDRYKKRIEVLEKENRDLKQKLNETTSLQNLTLNYIENPEKHRFVDKKITLMLAPHREAQVLNEIEPNTVVEVDDFVEVNQEIWLYVTLPVFDTPTNMKGRIKESETQLYTKKNQSIVKSPLKITKGKLVQKVDFFTEIHSSEPIKLETDQTCILTDEQGEHAALSCAGGENYIANKSDILYPPLD